MSYIAIYITKGNNHIIIHISYINFWTKHISISYFLICFLMSYIAIYITKGNNHIITHISYISFAFWTKHISSNVLHYNIYYNRK